LSARLESQTEPDWQIFVPHAVPWPKRAIVSSRFLIAQIRALDCRFLAARRKAGLVRSRPGAAGGCEPVCRPSAITFTQIYQLIRPGTVFAMHSKRPNPRCPVGKRVQQGPLGHYRKAQAAKEHELAQSTVVDVPHDVLAAGK